jgi:lysozyme
MNKEILKGQIKRHEGEVLEIYEDSLGLKTLGIGHLLTEDDEHYDWPVGQSVDQEIVDAYFEIDFAIHVVETIHVFGDSIEFYSLPEDIQHVLVNMCFNLGAPRLSKFKKMLGCAKRHEWSEMATEMEDSTWFGQVGRRSKELQEMVLNV